MKINVYVLSIFGHFPGFLKLVLNNLSDILTKAHASIKGVSKRST